MIIKEKSHNNSAAYIKDHLSKGMAYLPDKSIDFNMAMSTPFLRPKIRTILVSSLISENEARIMGLEYAASRGRRIEASRGSLHKSHCRHIPGRRSHCPHYCLGTLEYISDFSRGLMRNKAKAIVIHEKDTVATALELLRAGD